MKPKKKKTSAKKKISDKEASRLKKYFKKGLKIDENGRFDFTDYKWDPSKYTKFD